MALRRLRVRLPSSPPNVLRPESGWKVTSRGTVLLVPASSRGVFVHRRTYRQAGQSLAEYVMVLALVALIGILVIKGVGQMTRARFAQTGQSLGGDGAAGARAGGSRGAFDGRSCRQYEEPQVVPGRAIRAITGPWYLSTLYDDLVRATVPAGDPTTAACEALPPQTAIGRPIMTSETAKTHGGRGSQEYFIVALLRLLPRVAIARRWKTLAVRLVECQSALFAR